MGELLLELLPLIIGAAALPVWIIITLFLLRGERGATKATAFVAGAVVVRLVQGAIFGWVFDAATQQGGEESANILASTLLLVVGILLLVAAYKKWQKEADPDAPPPKWKEFLRLASPLKAFGAGALIMLIAMKQWVFTLSALAVIEQGMLDRRTNTLAFIIFTLAAQSLMLIPIFMAVIAPDRSNAWLGAMERWLERHERVIMIGVSLLFGLIFSWKGLTGLGV